MEKLNKMSLSVLQDEECCPEEEIPYAGSTFNVGLRSSTAVYSAEVLCQQKKVSHVSVLDLNAINEN